MEQVQPPQPTAGERPAVPVVTELARMTRGLRWIRTRDAATTAPPLPGERRQPPRAA